MAKRKTKATNENKIASAALQLAEKQGWQKLTLDQIARSTKIPSAQLKKSFSNKDELLPVIIRFIDDETATTVGKLNPNDSPHDRLFEVIMGRLDVIQSHRRAVLSIMKYAQGNAAAMLRRLLPVQAEAMRKMLQLAGVAPAGPREPIAVAGLLGIYALTIYSWRKDDSIDMSKTMATLDRYLRRAEKIAEILFRG